MDKPNITAKQFRIHRKNWEQTKRKIIYKLWGVEFSENADLDEINQFLQKAGRLLLLQSQFLANKDSFLCDCGACE